MAFEGLSEKLNATFKRLRGKGRLTEADVREGMREVRLALLEADVSYKVVKDFVADVYKRQGYVGWEKLTTDKSVVRIVSDAVIGEPATDALADTAEDVRGLTDKAGEDVYKRQVSD